MAELWAYCETCARWYYVPAPHGTTAPLPDCPVCQSEPIATRTEQAEEVAAP
jgi:hypothetical protein